MIVRRCLTSSNAHCSSDYSNGRDGNIMRWQSQKITWVNPQMSDYTDNSQLSRSALMNSSEWEAHCQGQSPSPWHHLQVKIYSNAGGILIADHTTGYSHCFGVGLRNR